MHKLDNNKFQHLVNNNNNKCQHLVNNKFQRLGNNNKFQHLANNNNNNKFQHLGHNNRQHLDNNLPLHTNHLLLDSSKLQCSPLHKHQHSVRSKQDLPLLLQASKCNNNNQLLVE